MILYLIIVCVLAYLIGSIPTGYIVVKLLKNEDIRTIGSGSTGATNVKRVLGKGWFFAVMIMDALKGAMPVLLAIYFSKLNGDFYSIAPTLAGASVLIGHSKSLFLGFKGGKSVASGVGTILALSPLVGLVVALIWAVITYLSRYVSAGSIIALFLSPFLMFFTGKPLTYVIYCTIGALYIIYLHRENVSRLIKGEENKVR